MDQSRRKFLKGVAASTPLAGCIVIKKEDDNHDYDHKGKWRERTESDRQGVEKVSELEPTETDIEETLESTETESEARPRNPSMCDTGYVETYLTLSEGETVQFEEPNSITGGKFSVEGHLTDEGDRVRIQYGPSVLYLDYEGETDFFSFEQGPFPEWGYGDYDGRYFGLHEYEEDDVVVATGLIYDKWGPNRREAIGVCIDQ